MLSNFTKGESMPAIMNVKYHIPDDLGDERTEAKYREDLFRILELIREISSDELKFEVFMSINCIDNDESSNYHSENYPDIALVIDVPNDEFDDSEEIRVWLQKKSIHLLEELESIYGLSIKMLSWVRPFNDNFPSIN